MDNEKIVAVTQLILTDARAKFAANYVPPEIAIVIIDAVAKRIYDEYITRSILGRVSIADNNQAEDDAVTEGKDA